MSYAPLAVLKASAEKERDIAAATIERAGNLPGLSATASGGTSPTDYGLQITSDSLFDLGTGARLQAIEATSEAAQRKVAQAQEDSRRSLMGLQSKLEASVRAEQEAHVMTQQAKRNLDIFQQQYEAGQRQVMDVVGVYETWARALKAQTEHKYKAARYNLMIANSIRAHPKQFPLAQSHQLSLDSIRRLKSHPRSSQSVANPSLLRHADREQCKALESTASIRQLWQSRCDHREFREPPSAPVSLVTTPPGRQHNQTTTTANQRQMLRPDRWHCGRLLRHLGRTSRDLPDQKIAALKK